MKRIVFFDVDHTLYDPIGRTIPQSAITAIKALHQQPHTLIGIATGRASYMLDLIAEIKPYLDVIITINGQLIYHHDQLIEDDPLDAAAIREVIAVFQEERLTYGFIGKHQQAINRLDTRSIAMFEEANLPLPIEDENFHLTHQVYQLWAFADKDQMRHLQARLPHHQLVPWLSDGFDVIHSTKSKKDGILTVLRELDVSLESCVCFGDGDNDIAMLEGIPNSVAMGNAQDHVKAKAAYVTESLLDDGILKALKRLGWLDDDC